MDKDEYGKFGENLACNYLKKRGYKILAKNYKTKVGEVDIIALETKKVRKKQENYKSLPKALKEENKLVFVEVKSRKTRTGIRPSDAVDQKKTNHYNLIAEKYRRDNPKYELISYRFDIIEIIGEEVVEHLIDAF